MGKSAENSKYRADIDGLRAVAVLAVLLFHIDLAWVQGGFVGVDVFFVISGFLITRIIVEAVDRGEFSFRTFYARRARRILPALLATLAGTFVGAGLLFSPTMLAQFAETLIAAALSVSNFWFWSNSGYFDLDAKIQPLLHTWSLGVEEQFYLVWPALLVAAFWWRGRAGALIAIVSAGIVTLVAGELFLPTAPAAVFFWMPFRVSEFALGAALVWGVQYQPRWRWLSEVLFAAGLALIVIAIVTYRPEMRFPGLSAMVPCAGAALVIYAAGARQVRKLLDNPAMVAIGAISYSLYLVHWPVVVFYKYATLEPLTPPVQVGLLASAFVLALILYYLVEKPFRYPAAAGGRPVRPAFAGAAFVALLGIALTATGGWTWRLGDRAIAGNSLHKELYGGRDCKEIACTANAGKPGAIYLVGDSHARALYHGFSSAFDGELRMIASAGCPIFAPNYRREMKAWEACQTAREQAYAAIAESDAPVLIAQFWGIGRLGLTSIVDGARRSFKSFEDYAAFVAEEIRSLRQKVGDRPIAVLLTVPKFGGIGSPLDCVSRPLFRPESCRFNPRSARETERTERLNDALATALTDDVVVIDPFEVLCTDEACVNFVEGQPIYSDANHLSVYGADIVVSAIRGKLMRLQASAD